MKLMGMQIEKKKNFYRVCRKEKMYKKVEDERYLMGHIKH